MNSPGIEQRTSPPRYFVFDSYVNGWALRRGLRRIGIDLNALAEFRVLLPISKESPHPGDVLFFTEEASLGRFIGNGDFRFLPHRLCFPLDDKMAFAQIVCEAGEAAVAWMPVRRDREPEAFPVFVKSRHSWRHGLKRPRGYLCRDPTAYRNAISSIQSLGWTTEEFFLQQWLPDGVRNSFSVAGFFDVRHPPRAGTMLVTHKLLARAGGLTGSAMAVEVVRDPADMLPRTRALLARLDYAGPFELEFLFDASDGGFKILELNPRFWMQHGIFIDLADNALIRAYLGLGTDDENLQPPRESAVWVSGIALIVELARLNREVVRFVLQDLPRRAFGGTRIILEPSLPVIFGYLLRQAARRLPRPFGSYARGSSESAYRSSKNLP